MSSTHPLVSVIVPSFNQASFLTATLDSLLSQDYPCLETLLIDGGSTDGSLDIIRRYVSRLTRWVSEPDAGQAHAINKGLRLATGEIVAWLNSDDLYLPGAVRAGVTALQANPAAGMVYADGILIDDGDRILDRHRYRDLNLLDLLCFEVLLQPTVFLRRSALESIGPLDESLRLILDHQLWVRMAARFPIVHVPGYWAAERTYPQAKTMAAAGDFYAEAGRMLAWAQAEASIAPIYARNRHRIAAALECFGGRRMIDAGRYATAVQLFGRGLARDPRVVLRYWFKGLQAVLGLLGLQSLFLWYRRSRRRWQHREARLVLDSDGFRIVGGRS